MVSRLPHRAALVLLFAVAALVLLVGTASASPWASADQRMVDKINAERAAVGRAPLRVDAELQRVARDWSAVMASQDRLYHNPNLGSQIQRSWSLLGENVGWAQWSGASQNTLVDRVHASFMNSSAHRANVLRAEYNWVGVGVRVTSAGKLWATVTFMQGAGSPPPPPPPPPLGPGEFRDVNGGTHAPAIKAIALRGVTQGCTAELFCPERTVTRGQMASFIVRARNLPPSSRDAFVDDRGSTHEAAINAVAAAGITQGCAPGVFCPDAAVSRMQMASFIQRAWDLPLGTSGFFGDVLGTSVHALAINALADAEITLGCGGGLYCPNLPVRRAEMASFLARALGIV